MAIFDDFKAEYARQHPDRPALKHLSDEGLVWCAILDQRAKQAETLLDRMGKRLAALEQRDGRYHPE